MKKIIVFLFALTCTGKIFSQKSTVLFAIEKGIENENDIIAVPFVIYANGKYQDPPRCVDRSSEKSHTIECNQAKKYLLPVVKQGQWLYPVKPGKKLNAVKIAETIQFGFSDWLTYSGKIPNKPIAVVLTNNATLATQSIKEEIKILPKLKVRKDPEGYVLKNTLLEKIDIDGDGIAEIIYDCSNYEGHHYEIYSYKNNVWKKVYEGGYQGV